MKIRNILFAFLLLVLVSGCVHGGSKAESDFGTGVTQSKSGTTFDISGVPEKASNNSLFDLEVTATNRGSYSLEPGDVLVTLSNTNQFNFNPATMQSDSQITYETTGFTNGNRLVKALDSDVEGESNIFLFGDLNYVGRTIYGEDVTVPLSVNTCYYYTTTATVDVCVAKDVTSDICSSNEIKQVTNQAAPVHVSGFEQESSLISLNSIINSNVLIFISSYGNEKFEAYRTEDSGGLIDDTHLLDDKLKCTNSNAKRYSAVRLKSIRVGSDNPIGGEDIDKYCSVSVTPNVIILDEEGKASISCALPLTRSYSETRGDYVERMAITLDYLVSDSVTKSLTIVGT